jgi:presenilin enhancer 2
MDLSNAKVTDQDKIQLCKKYFFCGFAFLPFLWAINAVWFFRDAFCRPPFAAQKSMKTFVVLSAVGSLFWWAVLIAWLSVFVNRRADWGELGDRLSFNIPTGTR